MADREFIRQMSRKLANEGKLIEAGWLALRALVIDPSASPMQLKEMRMAFMAGAQHLFSSMIATLDQDTEPTSADLNRMDLIDKELQAFAEELKARVTTNH